MSKTTCSTALLLAILAGSAIAQPVVDGTKDSAYGSAKWVNSVPTSEPDNQLTTCDKNTIGGRTPATVTTGFELAIPLAAIGSPTGNFRLAGFINGGGSGFVSNQVIGVAPVGPTGELAQPANLGEPRLIDFTAIAGNQYATINAASSQPTNAPTLDGSRDSTYTLSGYNISTQTVRTGFGDATHGNVGGPGSGSEIDAVYYRIKSGVLYLFIAGNLETNGNHLDLFFDTVAGGQQQLLGDSPVIGGGANSLNRMGAGPEGPGLNFDAGFTADYHLTINLSGAAPFRAYADFAGIGPSATGSYLGYREAGAANGGVLADADPANGASNPNNIALAWNNSNILGVPDFCAPSGGNPNVANGSEMDALYSYIDDANQRVYVMITGNAQSDYTAWSLFFDVGTTTTNIPGNPALVDAGQNVLRGDNPDIDFGSPNAMGTGTDPLVEPGLTFDSDFRADYFISYKNGNPAGDGTNTDQYLHALVLRADGPYKPGGVNLDYGSYDGGQRNPGNNPITFDGVQGFPANGYDYQDGFLNNLYSNYGPRASAQNMINAYPNVPTFPATNLLVGTLDNSNLVGITGTTADSTAAQAVATGLEFSIAFSELGWDGTSPLKIAGFINTDGGRGGISSNILGDAVSGTPFTNSRTVNFETLAGKQYVLLNGSVTNPCPADFNGDTFVDDTDFVIFAQAYDQFTVPPANAACDLNGDTFVDDTDFVLFAQAYDNFVCP